MQLICRSSSLSGGSDDLPGYRWTCCSSSARDQLLHVKQRRPAGRQPTFTSTNLKAAEKSASASVLLFFAASCHCPSESLVLFHFFLCFVLHQHINTCGALGRKLKQQLLFSNWIRIDWLGKKETQSVNWTFPLLSSAVETPSVASTARRDHPSTVRLSVCKRFCSA